MEKMAAFWTYDPDSHAYYFRPDGRTAPPYLKQVKVEAVVDIAHDGTFAGIEITDPKAPKPRVRN